MSFRSAKIYGFVNLGHPDNQSQSTVLYNTFKVQLGSGFRLSLFLHLYVLVILTAGLPVVNPCYTMNASVFPDHVLARACLVCSHLVAG